MQFNLLVLALATLALRSAATPTEKQKLPKPIGQGPPEVGYTRNILYVGGKYNDSSSNASTYDGQQYVEELIPTKGITQPYPIVFFHGAGQSGVQWLRKPDNTTGWADYFLKQGYAVYLIEYYSVGRSASRVQPPLQASGPVSDSFAFSTIPEVVSANIYYQARYHTQWPGTGRPLDPTFDRFYAAKTSGALDARTQSIFAPSSCALLSLFSTQAIILSHSAGANPAFLTNDLCPQYIKAHIAIEAGTTPFTPPGGLITGSSPVKLFTYGLADVPLTYDPPVTAVTDLKVVKVGESTYRDGILNRTFCLTQDASAVRKLPNLAKTKVLSVVGEASVYNVWNHCIVDFLRQAGVDVEVRELVNEGIRGNAHFSMFEKNSDDIAAFLHRWITQLR